MADYQKRKIDYPKPYTSYRSKEVTVSGSETNYDVASGIGLFDTMQYPNELMIRVYDNPAYFRLNAVDNDLITIKADESMVFDNMVISNVYITTDSGSAAEVHLFTRGYR